MTLIVGSSIAIALAAGATVHGAFYRNSPVFGRVLHQLPKSQTDELPVSLTFDDGPNPESTPIILDTLRNYDVRATFFFLGRHVDRWPKLAARAAREGHQIGNHGYYHRKLHFKSRAYVREDILKGIQAITRATGSEPKFFRAPHGFRSPWVNPILRSFHQTAVGWSLGVWDSDCPGIDVIAQRTIDGTRPRSILLLHDGDGYDPLGDRLQTALAIGPIIKGLRAKGYTFQLLPS